MGRDEGGRAPKEKHNPQGLIYFYGWKQFWTAYQTRRGYVINKEAVYSRVNYEDMLLFMSSVLPVTIAEIRELRYKELFRMVVKARKEAKRREADHEKTKRKRK